MCPGESVVVTVDVAPPPGLSTSVDVKINGVLGVSRALQFFGMPGDRLVAISAFTPERYADVRTEKVHLSDCGTTVTPAIRPDINKYHLGTIDFDLRYAPSFPNPATRFLWQFGDGSTAQTAVPMATHDYTAALAEDKLHTTFTVQLTIQTPGQSNTVLTQTVSVGNAYVGSKQWGAIHAPIRDLTTTIGNATASGGFVIDNRERVALQFTSRRIEYHMCDPAPNPPAPTTDPVTVTIAARSTGRHQFTVPSYSRLEGGTSHVCRISLYLSGSASNGTPAFASVHFDVRDNDTMLFRVDDPTRKAVLRDIVARGLTANPDRITSEEIARLVRSGAIDTSGPMTPRNNTMPGGLTEIKCQAPSAEFQRPGDPCVQGDKNRSAGLTCQASEDDFCAAPPHIANAAKGDAIVVPGCGLVGQMLRALGQRYAHSGIMTNDGYGIRHSTANESRPLDHPVDGEPPTKGYDDDVLRFGFPGTIDQTIEKAFMDADDIRAGLQYQTFADVIYKKNYAEHEFGKNFERCTEAPAGFYPSVFRPDHRGGSTARDVLVKAAETAFAINGHYRFYAYTDGRVGNKSSIPTCQTSMNPWETPPCSCLAACSGLGGPGYVSLSPYQNWPHGSRATVCSSFVRNAFTDDSVRLWNPAFLTQAELSAARPASALGDGLFVYSASSRKDVAVAVEAYVVNRVRERIQDELGAAVTDVSGWLGLNIPGMYNGVTGIDANIARQIIMCFANDECGTPNSATANKSISELDLGEGNGAAPDDMRFWDVYGYDEPIIFHSGVTVRQYTWQPAAGFGNLAGTVYRPDGSVAANVSVSVAGKEVYTDENGYYHIIPVQAGQYEITARTLDYPQDVTVPPPLTALSDKELVVIQSRTSVQVVDLYLKPPPENYREVSINGAMTYAIRHVCGADEWKNDDPIDRTLRVDSFSRTARTTWNGSFRGQASFACHGATTLNVTLTFVVQMNDDRSVTIQVHSELRSNSDNGARDDTFVVAPFVSSADVMHADYQWDDNATVGKSDFAHPHFDIANRVVQW